MFGKTVSLMQILGSSLLIAGTTIGAGTLALPFATAAAGFLPSFIVYLLCWIVSMSTGLLFLEILCVMPKNSNIISMAEYLLGDLGKRFAWVVYVFLFTCLLIAYISAGGGTINQLLNWEAYPHIGLVVFTSIFAGVIALGTSFVDRFNRVMIIGFILSYGAFLALGFSYIDTSRLLRFQPTYVLAGLPVIFSAFSYQGSLPSIASYLQYDRKSMRMVIFIGTLIPFLIYIVWDALIKGIIPVEGPYGLLHARDAGDTAVDPLVHLFPNSPITLIGQAFAFFAMTTSFLGVALGLMDFWADGLKIEKKGFNIFSLSLVVFLPPLLIALYDPTIFYSVFRLAGGIGCVILLGVYPVIMVWRARYDKQFWREHFELPGGKITLTAILLFLACVTLATVAL